MENIYIIEKNLFESDAPVFCHLVNCLGVWGSGIAKSMREIFPDVYEKYRDICVKNEYLVLLGHTAIIQSDNRYIANMFTQERFGYDGKRYTSYDAFYDCLIHVRDFCEKNNINKIGKVLIKHRQDLINENKSPIKSIYNPFPYITIF